MTDYCFEGYLVSPRCYTQAHRPMKKLGITSEGVDWVDGEMSLTLSGTRPSLIKFLVGSGLYTPEEADGLVKVK